MQAGGVGVPRYRAEPEGEHAPEGHERRPAPLASLLSDCNLATQKTIGF